MNFRHVMNPGHVALGGGRCAPVFVEVEFREGRLSFTGVEGPEKNGNCAGSCGQIELNPEEFTRFSDGWDAAKVQRLADMWKRWHLNDLRAGCEHQRTDWNLDEEVEVVEYGLTTEAHKMRSEGIEEARRAAVAGERTHLSETALALLALEDWFKPRFSPPDADSPLSGCFEVRKRETKRVGWVHAHKHPKGVLCKPCEVCGYKYGTEWLFEEVPAEILEEIQAFPETTTTPAWV